MRIDEIRLYRITHINNIPHILKNGITHKNSKNANDDYISIGDQSLIENRTNKEVEILSDFANKQNPEYINLGDFIPFYFGIKMPMLYVIQNGGNFVKKPTPPEDIIYLICSLEKMIQKVTEYYFSDGHSTNSLTAFYDKSMINKLGNIIDWNSVNKSYWGGDENLDLKRKKQAEFLVKEDIGVDCILFYGC